jgi:hypothetical protein
LELKIQNLRRQQEMSSPSFFFDPHGLLPHGQSSGATGAAVDVAAQIRSIRSDRTHPYNQPKSADHQRAVEEVAALYARLPLPEAALSDELDIAL